MSKRLEQIGPDLWTYERQIVLAGGLPFPARSVLVRGRGERVLLVSPLPMDPPIRRAAEALGSVQAIVAPNLVHHLFLRSAHQHHSMAAVFGPPGLERKQPGVPYQVLPEAGGLPPLGDDVQVCFIAGAPSVAEHVFFHVPSRTLILTDLLFHVRTASSWKTRVFLRLMGAYGKPAQSRLWRWLVKDRRKFRSALQQVLEWPFERVVMAHGEPIAGGASATVRRAWSKFLS